MYKTTNRYLLFLLVHGTPELAYKRWVKGGGGGFALLLSSNCIIVLQFTSLIGECWDQSNTKKSENNSIQRNLRRTAQSCDRHGQYRLVNQIPKVEVRCRRTHL